jgi:hypothetical protein
MNKHSCRFKFLGIIIFLALIAAFSFIAMLLWNKLMPEIFGLTVLNYYQAIGLVILSRILLGGLGSRFHGCKHCFKRRCVEDEEKFFDRRNALREKWLNMSDEIREKFMRSYRGFNHWADFFEKEEKLNEKDKPKDKGKDNE